MPRERCLLDNEKIMNYIVQLKGELFKDFAKNSLKSCEVCEAGFEDEDHKLIHAKLLNLYNDLSLIARILSSKKDK